MFAVTASHICTSSSWWDGYWTAKTRTNRQPSSTAECIAYPFVWVMGDKLVPEQSWESSIWYSGKLNCANNGKDACVTMVITANYLLVDVTCSATRCAMCQMDVLLKNNATFISDGNETEAPVINKGCRIAQITQCIAQTA